MKETQQTDQLVKAAGMSRRKFFGMAGGLAGAGLLLGTAGCKSNDDDSINLGSGDTGILNYAYALEQLEAAFYTKVIMTPFNGMTAMEKERITEIRDHEIAHREFFKAAIGGDAIPGLEVNFTSINFSDRASVLGTAKAFEDLGVSAYNGAGKLISNVDYLLIAGKIVSVEARHAAYIRDILTPGTFTDSDVIDINGLDVSRSPAEVLAIAQKYLYTQLNANNLPNG
jgi:hypothetical protein